MIKYNVNLTDNNNVKTNKKISLSTNKNRKSLSRNNNNDLIDEKDFVKNINSLYLFNHKKNVAKDLDLPILI